MPTLTIQLPGQPPVSHVLKDETITIGRMKGNTIVIEDSSISLMHAKITRKDGEFYLKDLNSTNGTIVNGQPIGEARLRDQDRVRFADITTQFVADVVAPAPVLAAPAIAQPATPAPPASVSATAASAAPTSAASAKPIVALPEKKASPPRFSKRVLAIAATIVVVVLPGLGFLGYKYFAGKTPESEAFAPSSTSKKKAATEVASKVAAPKAPVEAKPATEPAPVVDSATPTLNVPELLTALKSNDPVERRQAASTLHGAGMEATNAIPALREALKDSDEEVQMWASLALVNTQTYDKAVIPILVRALKNDNAVLRQVACLSLGLIPYEPGDKSTIIPALTDAAANDKEEDVRTAAKSALSIVAPEAPESAAIK